MYFALMGKLSARRQNLAQDKDKGFTLIELLVVVVIIGILAAIAIPVYLNVTNNAKDSGTKSDITNFKVAAISIQTSTGTLPTAGNYTAAAPIPGPLLNAGASMGSNTTGMKYQVTTVSASAPHQHFCIEGTSATGKTFTTTDTAGVKDGATCTGGVSS